MNNRKKIVITGASGFLGSHLAERLKDDEKYIVYALSSRPEALKAKIGGASVAFLHKDAFKESGEFLRDAVVVHCAYPRNSTGTAIADGLKYIQGVFEAAVENKAAAIINISSQSVYSQQRTEAATEQTPVCLESPYAVGKYAVELMLESICKGSGTKYTSLRMASLIGPGFDQRIVNRFVKQAVETGEITVKKNNQRFGFFDVEDAVGGLMAMLASTVETWDAVYNLGNKHGYTLLDIALAVSRALSASKQITVVVEDEERFGNSSIDASKFCRAFDFDPSYNLADSVLAIVRKYEGQSLNEVLS